MTDHTDLIRAGREALEGVSMGPWHYERGDLHHVCHPMTTCDATTICNIDKAFGQEANARFIAWSRAGVPALIDALEAVTRERDAEAGWVVTIRDERDTAIRQRNAWQDRAEAADAALKEAVGVIETVATAGLDVSHTALIFGYPEAEEVQDTARAFAAKHGGV